MTDQPQPLSDRRGKVETFDAYVRRVAPDDADLILAEVERLRGRLADAEAVVYGLCDAWGGDTPDVDDPGNVVFACWLAAAGYHVDYRLGLKGRDSAASDESQEER